MLRRQQSDSFHIVEISRNYLFCRCPNFQEFYFIPYIKGFLFQTVACFSNEALISCLRSWQGLFHVTLNEKLSRNNPAIIKGLSAHTLFIT